MAKQNANSKYRFDPDDTATLTLNFPKKLRERVRERAKTLRTSSTAFVVMAITQALEHYDEKERVERERERREKEEQRERRRASLLPQPLPIAPDVVTRLDPSLADEDVTPNKLYNEHATRIAEKLDGDVRELRLRRDEAVAAIKKQFPLTHPPEEEIVAKLEKLALKIKPTLKPKDPPKPEDSDDEDVITIK